MHQAILANGSHLAIEALKKGIFRIRISPDGKFREPLLTRYGILRTDWVADACDPEEARNAVIIDPASGKLTFHAKHPLEIMPSGEQGSRQFEDGFRIDIPLSAEERLYGLGDETHDRVMKRGHRAVLWQSNISCYGPIPLIMSTGGWGILVNCTYRQVYDVGCEDKGLLRIDSPKGPLDFYVFLGNSLRELIGLYTDVSGKPILLPKAAYGFTFVCNEEYGAHDLLDECRNFRKEQIPCDIMGLEPGWMEEHYDYSVNKRWHPERFYIVHWRPYNEGGPDTFFAALRRMGFKLSLWLCCDYDLFWEEEQQALMAVESSDALGKIQDEHLSGARLMDEITKPGEPWFEHLKKFVDQGAAAFKLDGANQIIPHPDRLWASRYFDDEIHNLYPVVYGKQMKEGFSKYTGRRALIYTPGLYAGTQQYCASWAGDTGGDNKTLVSILNLAMCGHSNATCDLDPTNTAGIHYGFLMPWSQHLTWRHWTHPWYLEEEQETVYRYYAQLRSSLFPYLYSMFHIAAETGYPVARPLCLAFPENPDYDHALNAYMLGDSLLVGAFDMRIPLPRGRWTDFWTGGVVDGGRTIEYAPPQGRGGALYVKEGAVIVRQPWMPFLGHHAPETLEIHVYPGADGAFTLCEDDYETYRYMQGEVARTEIEMRNTQCSSGGLRFSLAIGERKGQYGGMGEVCGFTVLIHYGRQPRGIACGSDPVPFTHDGAAGTTSFAVPKQLHAAGKLEYSIEL